MIKTVGTAALGATVLGIPLAAQAVSGDNSKRRRKILVIGAHPDDPETGCGGTMCLLADAGHEVVCVYLTRGEAGIAGKSHDEAAAIRVVESENACKITGARHIFMNQIDGNTEVNLERYKEMRELIDRENPDVVLTHCRVRHPCARCLAETRPQVPTLLLRGDDRRSDTDVPPHPLGEHRSCA